MLRILDRVFARPHRRAWRAAAFALAGLVIVSAAWAARPSVQNPHGDFREECGNCHGAQGWKPAKPGPKFDHAKYGLPLEGAHAAANCMSCHTSLQFAQSKTQCQSCHEDPHRGEMGLDCARCHGAKSFTDRAPMVRAHQLTRLPLTGGHATVDCERCHTPQAQGRLQFVNTRAECQSCHLGDYRSAKEPDHATSGFPTTCQNCHSPQSWHTAAFDHDRTDFPLTGRHRATNCTQCHTSGQMTSVSTACSSCHQTQYAAATPPHAAAGFAASACASCHNTTSFADATFSHGNTSFPLTGAHVAAACNSCHASGVYDGLATTCQSCHQGDYTSAPINHSAAGFAAGACATCHTTARWTGATYDHGATSFPLTGSHTAATCQSCHTGTVFNNLSTACQSCHTTEYNAATPPHPASGFAASACATCHNTTAWAGATFNHNTSSFPLTGAHTAAACNTCHASGVYNGLNTACQSCHQSDYTAAPLNHTAAGFAASACATCHGTTTWNGATYNHGATSFPLTGAHVAADCARCHTTVFNNLASDCASCHQVEYNAATPPHPASGFAASACATCHNTTAWAGATFNHNTSSFPLTGAHVAAACNTCHASGVYNGLNTACQSCHMTDYNAATPPHAAAGFAASACATCHGTSTWSGATFNHGTTSFPLTGAHTSAACNTCHSSGVYNGLNTACQSCHQTDYNTATPNHAAAGFAASACATCHTTTTWSGATFNHDASWFPIYSGKHRGKWSDCATCHTVSSNFASFTCLSCHPHSDRAKTDGDHRGRSGYSYDSAACYRCHPRGNS